MRPARSLPSAVGPSSRRLAHYEGLFFDEFASESAWIRERGLLRLPPLSEKTAFVIEGEFVPHPEVRGIEAGPVSADLSIDGRPIESLRALAPGPFRIRFEAGPAGAGRGSILEVRLRGTAATNFLAWVGRLTAGMPIGRRFQRFRQQNKNRQFRLNRIVTEVGQTVFDFSNRHAPFSSEFARRRAHLGMNISGFLTADLGLGESARCMVRAAGEFGRE